MKTVLRFDQIVGLADKLPFSQKESLVEILSKRLIEERRTVLRKDIKDANREFAAGACRVVTPVKLMQEITG